MSGKQRDKFGTGVRLSRGGGRILALAGLTAALFAGSFFLHAQSPSLAGSAHYTIWQGGKSLGDAQYSVAPVAGGYSVTSGGHMALGKFSYGFHHVSTLDASMNLVHDTLSGSVNGTKVHGTNVGFNTASDASGREFQISISADGKQSANTVDRHRNTVLVPDLDPGAYLLMAKIALMQPQSAWALIPKETGILVPVDYEPKADVRGTLKGASLTVKHTAVVMSETNAVTLDLYHTGDGQLLEADVNAQNMDVVEDGFKLLEHPAATPPPAGEAPQQPAGQGQQPGGRQPGAPQ